MKNTKLQASKWLGGDFYNGIDRVWLVGYGDRREAVHLQQSSSLNIKGRIDFDLLGELGKSILFPYFCP